MLEIRKSYPTDAYTLINISDISWKNAFYDILPNGILHDNLQNVKKRIKHLQDQITENNRIFVAIEDGIPIGYIFYAAAQNVIYESAAEIRAIYILPEFQRKGIGTKLFEQVRKELSQLGFKSLIIYSPQNTSCVNFFLKLGGEKKEVLMRNTNGHNIAYDLIYYDLIKKKNYNYNNWNYIYQKAQEHLYLLNNINREIAVISTSKGNMYIGIGIKNRVCPIESALANMHISEEREVSKILVLNRQSKPVLPCGKCRDLLIGLGQENAEILFDYGTLQTMTMHDLNPYYKDEEKA